MRAIWIVLALAACDADSSVEAVDDLSVVDQSINLVGHDLAHGTDGDVCAHLSIGSAGCPLCDPLPTCTGSGCGPCGDDTETCHYADYSYCWCDASGTLYCSAP